MDTLRKFFKSLTQATFFPAIRTMNYLKYPQKFLLISILFILPLAFAMHLLITEINDRIAFSQKEIYGDEYLRPLRKLMEDVPQSNYLAHQYLKGDASLKEKLAQKTGQIEDDFKKLDAVERKFGSLMSSTDKYDSLKESWRNLKVKILNLSPAGSDEMHAQVIADIRALISRVGDTSNLILDPDLDTYYLMDTMLLKLPETQNILAELQLLGIDKLTQEKLDPAQKAELIGIIGLARANIHAVNQGLGVAFRNNPAQNLVPHLEKPLEQFLANNEEFLELFDKQILNATSIALKSPAFEASVKKALESAFALWDESSVIEDVLLNARNGGFENQKNRVVLFSVLMLLGVGYLLKAFYMAVLQTVSVLSEATRKMLAGDMTQELKLDTRDELGEVGKAFNDIVLRLKKEWQQAREESVRASSAEEKLKSAHGVAVEASRAKSDFLATMSHEIRTPMNAIIGMSELLAETNLSEEQKEYVQTLTRNGESLLSLINDILDLSKVEAGRLELEKTDFSLSQVIEQVTEMMALKAHQKGIELLHDIQADVPNFVVGDPNRLRQVLVNLVGNAIKFTEKGEVVVTVKCNEVDEGDSHTVRLFFSVRDTGIGIPSDKARLLFNAFTQVDSSTTRKYGGTGLGLAISKKLVECMGGEIGLESTPGQGTTFHFTVQLGLQKALEKQTAQSSPSFQGMRVLIVDDNATNRLILREWLKNSGSEVTEVSGGQEGLDELVTLKETGRSYQLILLDCRMPEMDGFEFAERVKSDLSLKGVTIMMLTSDNRNGDIGRAKALGLNAYLVKPVKKEELFKAIQNIMGRFETSAFEEKSAPPTFSQADQDSMRILLVEDNEDNQLLIQSYLKKTPYQLEIVENGKEACQKIKNSRYDLVLMDLHMPVMDGYTATREIRRWEKERPERTEEPLPIVAVSASALKEEVHKSIDAGCNQHLTKPLKKTVLLETIKFYEEAKWQKVRAA